jgi:hypothetical protein
MTDQPDQPQQLSIDERVGVLTATVDQLQAEQHRLEQATLCILIALVALAAVGAFHSYQLHKLAQP